MLRRSSDGKIMAAGCGVAEPLDMEPAAGRGDRPL